MDKNKSYKNDHGEDGQTWETDKGDKCTKVKFQKK